MIVCSCHAVTDREIRRAVRAGACSVRDVAESCRAGSACGGCRGTVLAILDEAHGPRERYSVTVSISLASASEAI